MKHRRSALIFAIGGFALFINLAPANSHSQLVSSDPVDGSVLSAAPAKLVLTFNEALLEEAVAVAISNSSGAAVSGTVASSAGAIVTIPWPAELPSDTYTVSYRIVSADAHPVTGSISFTYTFAGSSPSIGSTSPIITPVATAVVAGQPGAGFPIGVVGLILALAATVTVIILARRGRK